MKSLDANPASDAGKRALRVLYICYLSLEDPLVHSQVVAYLAGLAERGHAVHLLTFEPRLERARRRQIEDDLGRGARFGPELLVALRLPARPTPVSPSRHRLHDLRSPTPRASAATSA